jgi:hypothetical protein
MEQNFCPACLFIFKNVYTINSQSDNADLFKTVDLTSEGSKCKFCFGVFNRDIYPMIFDKIKQDKIFHEYADFKLSTNFSALYSLFHHYVLIFNSSVKFFSKAHLMN